MGNKPFVAWEGRVEFQRAQRRVPDTHLGRVVLTDDAMFVEVQCRNGMDDVVWCEAADPDVERAVLRRAVAELGRHQ